MKILRLLAVLALSLSLWLGTTTWTLAQPGGAGGATEVTLNALLTATNSLLTAFNNFMSTSATAYGTTRLSNGTSYVQFGTLTPCQTGTWVKQNINVAATARTLVFESTGATKAYICGGWLSSHAANVLSIVEDTDADNCNSSEAALAGSTTDTEGSVVFAANGGINFFGAAVGQVLVTSATGKDICFDATTADRIVGVFWIVEGS